MIQEEITLHKRSSKWMRKLSLVVLLGIGVTAGATYVEGGMAPVHHVYVDGEEVGTVSSKEIIGESVEERLQKAEEAYGVEPMVEESITYESERLMNPEYDNEAARNTVQEDITVSTEATAISFDGKTAGYVEGEEQAEQALTQYKQQFADNELLEAFENEEDVTIDIGEGKLTEFAWTTEPDQKTETVHPREVKEVDEVVRRMNEGTTESKAYEVKEEEDLSSVLDTHQMSEERFRDLNPEVGGLEQGQTIQVEEEVDYTNVEVTKEKIVTESIPFETKTEKTDELLKGETKVKQEGEEGQKKVRYSYEKEKLDILSQEKLGEKNIESPTPKIILEGTKTPSVGSGEFTWPAVGGTMTSGQGERWGSYHAGIDIAGVSDRTIKAADHGVVKSAGTSGAYGNRVVIDHNNGYETVYAHLSSIGVSKGDKLQKGEKLGDMGTTGRSTGVHLHFEISKNGSLKNPSSYVSK